MEPRLSPNAGKTPPLDRAIGCLESRRSSPRSKRSRTVGSRCHTASRGIQVEQSPHGWRRKSKHPIPRHAPSNEHTRAAATANEEGYPRHNSRNNHSTYRKNNPRSQLRDRAKLLHRVPELRGRSSQKPIPCDLRERSLCQIHCPPLLRIPAVKDTRTKRRDHSAWRQTESARMRGSRLSNRRRSLHRQLLTRISVADR